MPKRLQGYITTIVGALVTLSLSLYSDFILNLPEEITWLTFFIGAIVTITATLLEQRLLNATSEEISQKLGIYNLLSQIEDPELLELAQTAINTCARKLQEYANGTVIYPSHGYLTDRVSKCTKSLYTTFWAIDKTHLYNVIDTPAGKSYYQLNEDLIGRGVTIERVFILKQSEMIDEQGRFADMKALNIIRGQQEQGITVRISWIDKWGHYTGNSELFRDFAILDGDEVLGHIYRAVNASPQTTLFKKPNQVKEHKEIYERLRKLSHPLDEILAEYPPINSQMLPDNQSDGT